MSWNLHENKAETIMKESQNIILMPKMACIHTTILYLKLDKTEIFILRIQYIIKNMSIIIYILKDRIFRVLHPKIFLIKSWKKLQEKFSNLEINSWVLV